jgi:hypothetical protein
MENNTNLLGQLNISNYSIHILSKYIHELILKLQGLQMANQYCNNISIPQLVDYSLLTSPRVSSAQ